MSITKDQLIQYIEKPGLLKEQTIGDLKEIVEEFPYFQTAQLLYTYNLCARDNFRYEAYLKTCSIYATDRSVLYRLLHPPTKHNPPVSVQNQIDPIAEDSSMLLEFSDEKQMAEMEEQPLLVVESNEEDIIDFDLLSFEQPDDLFQLDEPESAPVVTSSVSITEASTPKTEKKVDLIEQFIKVNPTIQPRTEALIAQNEHFELKEEEETENDEFITETLSRIYLKQGHHQKAIDSFKRLSLKFPEKSVYFAQQIEEIKKLLN